jgi:aminoglycoside phosphotransferase (APT) family kinase protein
MVPDDQAGTRRLAVERQVLDLLAARCSFRAPRVLHADEAGWQVRDLVPGLCDPWDLYRRARADRTLARRIGHTLGGILAEQHARVGPTDVAGWLPRRLSWPEPSDQLRDKLPRVVADAGLLRVIERILRRYEDQEGEAAACDRVLTHGDLGLHNIALAPGTDEVAGVFDYGDAAWADRHQDFRYLVFPGAPDEDLLDGALEAYEPLIGRRLDRDRIRLCNAACAIGFLGFRCGTPPETRSCGRTLAEDLQWVTHALQGLTER